MGKLLSWTLLFRRLAIALPIVESEMYRILFFCSFHYIGNIESFQLLCSIPCFGVMLGIKLQKNLNNH
jgi:hypothetical protein